MRVAVVPLLAAFIMVAWDLAMDPVWGTVLHAWIWKQGGRYFGVSVSNFVGWYLTVYVIFQIFALYLRRRTIHPRQLPSGYWDLAIVFYAVSAAGNLILAIPHNAPTIVSDPTGVQWKVTQIVGICVLVSVFVMGTFAVLAWTRLARPRAGDVNQSPELETGMAGEELCKCGDFAG
jgi:putative membrane protein